MTRNEELAAATEALTKALEHVRRAYGNTSDQANVLYKLWDKVSMDTIMGESHAQAAESK